MNVAVLIPSYNASATLPALLERTLPIVPKERIIVVNDGSTDGTGETAALFGVTVLSHPVNKGKGAALQTGFDHFLSLQSDAVVTMDADLQHEPETIRSFVTAMEDGNYDVVIGSRMHNTTGMPVHRLLSNTITSFLVRLRTGAAVSDSQSGFRLIGRNVLKQLRLESAGFEAETEFIIKAAALGCRFGSVPVNTIYAGEKSNMTHLRTTVNFIKILLKRF